MTRIDSKWRLAYAILLVVSLCCVKRAASRPQQPVERKVVLTIDDVPGAIPYNDYDVGTLESVRQINR